MIFLLMGKFYYKSVFNKNAMRKFDTIKLRKIAIEDRKNIINQFMRIRHLTLPMSKDRGSVKFNKKDRYYLYFSLWG